MLIQWTGGYFILHGQVRSQANSSETNPLWAKLLQKAAAVVPCRKLNIINIKRLPSLKLTNVPYKGGQDPKGKDRLPATVFRGHVSFPGE